MSGRNGRLRIHCIGVAALLLLQAGPEATAAGLRPDDATVTSLGARVYTAHCAACHGARLEGQPNWRQRDAAGRLPAPPHDASGHTWHHPDDVLFRITKFGIAKVSNLPGHQSSMPVYEGVLSDDEIVAVLSWIKLQWPSDVRARHDAINQAASDKSRPARDISRLPRGFLTYFVASMAVAIVALGVTMLLARRKGSTSKPPKAAKRRRKAR